MGYSICLNCGLPKGDDLFCPGCKAYYHKMESRQTRWSPAPEAFKWGPTLQFAVKAVFCGAALLIVFNSFMRKAKALEGRYPAMAAPAPFRAPDFSQMPEVPKPFDMGPGLVAAANRADEMVRNNIGIQAPLRRVEYPPLGWQALAVADKARADAAVVSEQGRVAGVNLAKTNAVWAEIVRQNDEGIKASREFRQNNR